MISKMVKCLLLTIMACSFRSSVQAEEPPYYKGLKANLYLVAGANLVGQTIDTLHLTPDSKFIKVGGWSSAKIEAEDGYLYKMQNGNLYGARIDGLNLDSLTLIDDGGWEGVLEVDNGYAYLMKNDCLYGATVNGLNISNLTLIDAGGWGSDMAVENGYIYLVKNNNLYGATITGRNFGSFSPISYGGWVGAFDVKNGYAYLMKNDSLWGWPIDDLNLGNKTLVDAGGWGSDVEFEDLKLPVWQEDMTFAAYTPIIHGARVCSGYDLVADPFLLNIGDSSLVCFFEAKKYTKATKGEIWMAFSDGDPLTEWGPFKKVAVSGSLHFSHPQAILKGDTVFVFYNYSGDYETSPHVPEAIYLSKCHRDSLRNANPWSSPKKIYDAPSGWAGFVEFSIFERNNLWYILGITPNSNGSQDKWIRGRWMHTFPGKWPEGSNTDSSQEIGTAPLVNIEADYGWYGFVEITYVNVDNTQLLQLGIQHNSSDSLTINALEISRLDSTDMCCKWLTSTETQGYSDSLPWAEDMHRAHVVLFKNKWVYAFDGKHHSTPPSGENPDWAIDFASINRSH